MTTAYKKLTLRGLQWDAEAGSLTLAAVLKSAAQARLSETSSGLVLTGTAGNGHTVSFALPATNGLSLSSESVAEMISDLLDRYDAAIAVLGGTPTDAQIFSEMLAQLVPIRSVTDDFSQLRTGAPLPA